MDAAPVTGGVPGGIIGGIIGNCGIGNAPDAGGNGIVFGIQGGVVVDTPGGAVGADDGVDVGVFPAPSPSSFLPFLFSP